MRGPAVFFAIIGLVMLLFCLLFLGFSVLFHQFREQMTEQWRQNYPKPLPPNVLAGVEVYPPTAAMEAADATSPQQPRPSKPACAA
jgi:hypothetical protein